MWYVDDIYWPLEFLYEFVLQDPSPASLARWCLVSRALLAFAGPLLYHTVILTRPLSVLMFMIRLVRLSQFR